MKKILVVVDMQNDFIDGVLGSEQAKEIVEPAAKRIKEFAEDYEAYAIICTADTHFDEKNITTEHAIEAFKNVNLDYLESREGKHLPIIHCLYGEDGYKFNNDISSAIKYADSKNKDLKITIAGKHSFGSRDLAAILFDNEYLALNSDIKRTEEYQFEFIGLCTDLCVLANVIMIQSYCPNSEIYLNTKCCAGSTPEMHEKAIDVMKNMHINII